MKLSELKANPGNPRIITDEKLGMLKKSLKKFGDLSGIVFNRRSKQLVGGHQRAKVIPPDAEIQIELKHKTPTKTGTIAEGFVLLANERFRYREVDWDEKTEQAANIAANQHGGEWEMARLTAWVKNLRVGGIDIDLLGFSKAELEAKFGEAKKASPGCDEDEVPPTPNKAKTKRGDIYVLGRHRLMCGDSTKREDVKSLMCGDLADLVFTDPPYGVDYDGGHADKGKRREKLANDDSTLIYNNSVPLMVSFSKPKSALYLWFAATKSLQVLQVLQANDFVIRSWLIWNKNMAQFGAIGAQYKQKHEPCLYAHKRGQSPFWSGPKNEVSVWDVQRSSKNEFHPTQKPTALAERAIANSCQKAGIVLDLFGGSGATLIAAEKVDRSARLMELSPNYCDVIVARWEKYTGQKAKLIKR